MIHILSLAPEEECFWQRSVSYLFHDLRNIPIRDDYYDTISCLSTLQHVGCDNSSFTGKDSEAQDLTQEVFLRVFRALKSYRSDEGAFATWLARLSRNLLIDHYRRTRQDRATDSIEEQLPMIEERAATSARPEGLLAGREASEILQNALQRLSPDLREAVILRDLQEMEYREIAEVLKVPEGTVKSRLNRGRAELARVLRQQRLVL
jgi:RNA polymerase sigma-70 factor (ECF subfamily)